MRAVYPGASVPQSSVLLASRRTSPATERDLPGRRHPPAAFDWIVELVDRAAGEASSRARARTGGVITRRCVRRGPRHHHPEEMVTRCAARATSSPTPGRAPSPPPCAPAGARSSSPAPRDGEYFDDHQQQIVDKLAELGLVVPLGERITAPTSRRRAPAAAPRGSPSHPSSPIGCARRSRTWTARQVAAAQARGLRRLHRV